MSIRMYTLPVEQTQWHVPGVGSTTLFNWKYDEGCDKLLGLYEKGKTNQWNSNDRLDSSLEVDLTNLGLPRLLRFGSRCSRQQRDRRGLNGD